MPRFASPHDGASIFYRDCIPEGPEPKELTLVFLHSWPMSSRMWEYHLIKLCQDHGFRCIAPDRRGFGDSEWNGRRPNNPAKSKITYDTFADDVIFLLEDLEVDHFVFIGASMGSGESLLCYERSPSIRDRCKVLFPSIITKPGSCIPIGFRLDGRQHSLPHQVH
jgi:non-heme chloroperoxidase